MKKIKGCIRYGYERPGLCVRIENPQSEMYCKVKDMEHFNLWCAGIEVLRDKGASIAVDHEISQYHGYGNWQGLEFKTQVYEFGLSFEFFQNVTISENRKGGQRNYYNYREFPYILKIRLKLAIKLLIEAFTPVCEASVTFKDRPLNAVEFMIQHYRKSGNNDNIKTLEDVQTSMTDYDLLHNNNDRDKKKIKCGEIKYFYSHDRYIHRGVVYHNCNNMWWVVENETNLRNISSFELFDRTNEPIKRALPVYKKIDRLTNELNHQIKADNFIRVNAILKMLNELKSQ